MSKQEERRPSIRFKSYTEPWEQRKATEIFYSVSDKNHIDLPVLSASQEYGMIKRNEIGIDIKYDKESIQTYKRVKPGQFVIHLRSFQGGFAHSLVEGITSPAYTVLDFSEENKHFDLFWREVFISKNFIKRLETVTYGIRDGRSISFTDFSSLNLQFPTLPEQRAIGSFFQELNQLITLQQRELELMKEGKKTLLSKMFPKDGENFPEIRFPGFTDAWEQRKFKDLSSKGGKRNSSGNEYPVYSVSNQSGLIPQSEQFEGSRLDTLDKNSYRIVEPNDFVYNPARINVGSIAFNHLRESIIVSSLYVIFSLNRSVDNRFALQFIKSDDFIKEVRKNTEGSVREYLFYENFSNIRLPLPPTLSEQTAIGSFFQELDQLITLQQRELEILKIMKSALLKAMFA